MKNNSSLKAVQKVLVIGLCFLSVVGIFYRILWFRSIPSDLYWDEAAIAADAKQIARTGHDLHGNHWFQAIFPSYGDYKLPAYIWVSSAVAHFTSQPQLIVRIPNLLIGLDLLFLVGMLSWLLFNHHDNKQKLSFLVGLFVAATAPWAIHFSRAGFEAYLGQYLLAIAVLLATRKKATWLILSQITAALAVYSYYSVRFVWPALFGLIVVVNHADALKTAFNGILNKEFLEKNIKSLLFHLLSLVIFILLLIPLQNSPHFDNMQQFRLSTASVLNIEDWALLSNQMREQAGNTFISRFVYHRHWLMARQLIINLSQNLSVEFMFLSGDENLRHHSGFGGMFLFPMIVPLVIGLFYLYKKSKRLLLLLVGWWLIALIPASAPMEVPHALRSLNALVPLCLIMSYGLISWIRKIMDDGHPEFLKSKRASLIALFGLLTVMSASLLAYGVHYRNVYPALASDYWQEDFDQLALKLCEIDEERSVMIDVSDRRFFLWVLSYCDWNDSQLQAADFEDYQLRKIDNLEFTAGRVNLREIETNSQLLLSDQELSAQDEPTINSMEEWQFESKTFSLYELKSLANEN